MWCGKKEEKTYRSKGVSVKSDPFRELCVGPSRHRRRLTVLTATEPDRVHVVCLDPVASVRRCSGGRFFIFVPLENSVKGSDSERIYLKLGDGLKV